MTIRLTTIIFLLTTLSVAVSAQSQTHRALFLGNSYTQYNNLPLLVANMALSTGDELIFDSNTPGGYTFEGHSTNATSTAKIMQGNWDFVILQEQSQLPSFPIGQVETQVLPYAQALDALINEYNECAETVFYMTWGRKNGDAQNCPSWTPVCTYEGMDDLLNERYQLMAELNNAVVSPVGAVWRYIRTNHPEIELYAADESHPSAAGSYAAACAFYTVIFRKNPTLSDYNFNLSADIASIIRTAAETVVFNNLLQWHVGEYDLTSNFETTFTVGQPVQFNNLSQNAISYLWNFGDGNTSLEENPLHTYNESGLYEVQLTTYTECDSAVSMAEVNFVVLNTANTSTSSLIIYPNPVQDFLVIDNRNTTTTNLVLMDAAGAIIWQSEQGNIKTTLNLSNQPAGLYLLKIWDNNSIPSVHKIMRANN